MLPSGHIVLSRYRIDRLIGVGGMGLIFRAYDTHAEPEEAVAIKVLRPSSEQTEKDLKRFEREARLLSQLSHSHVLDVREVGELQNGIPLLVMELLEGRDLRQEIRVRQQFPVEEAVGYVMQAAEASSAVHDAGIVHRDIKPQNLFITQLAGARHLKLLDFGISKQTEGNEATLTATQGTLGTPQYMSPEQIFGAKDVDQRSDIWALGVILYFLLSGRLPFTGPTPGAVIAMIPNSEPRPLAEFRNDIPPELIEVCKRCLRKEPEGRFDTARDLVDALLPFGPPDGTIIAPVVDMPSTVPPVLLKGSLGHLDVLSPTALRWGAPPDPERTPSLDASAGATGTPAGPAGPAGLDLLPVGPAPAFMDAPITAPDPELTAPSSRRRDALQRKRKEPRTRTLAFLVGAALAMTAAWWVGTRGAPRSEQSPDTTAEAAPPTSADELVLEPAQPPTGGPGSGPEELDRASVNRLPSKARNEPGSPATASPKPVAAPGAPPATTADPEGPEPSPRPARAPQPKPRPKPPAPAPAPQPSVAKQPDKTDAPPLYL